MQKQGFRPTFYLTINALFILFILTVGGILAWHSYQDTKEIVLSEADRDYERVLAAISDDFKHTYQPVFTTVGLLARTSLMAAQTLEQRLQELRLLTVAARDLTVVSGLQVGYANGDYVIVRAVDSSHVRELFAVPERAAYIFDHIATDPGSGGRALTRIFFDESLTEILRQSPEPTDFDARTRPWYLSAMERDRVAAVEPYLFYFSKVIGTTVSYRPPESDAVIAADVTLKQLSLSLRKYLLTPSSEIALVNAEGLVLGYSKSQDTVVGHNENQVKIAHVGELDSDVFPVVVQNDLLRPGVLDLKIDGKAWHGAVHPFRINSSEGRELMLVMLSPHEELLAHATRMTQKSLMITLGILLLSIPLASLISSRISTALTKLAEEAVLISRFDFARPLSLRSRIKEVDELARAMESMKNTVSRFLALLKSLAGEQNFDAMLEQITEVTLQASESEGALTWFVDDETGTLNPVAFFARDHGRVSLDGLPSYALDASEVLAQATRSSEVSHLQLNNLDHADLAPVFATLESEDVTATVFPLKNRNMEEIGLLCLFSRPQGTGSEDQGSSGRMEFVRTFSGFASVSLESRYLLKMQKRLMDSFVHLLAGAIDAKSPYTGGHCQRVPVLAKMLAAAACEDEGRFKDYTLEEDEWEALHLAAWLHDCGKVTTPEYVVDKATKLETINDRIHEIRTRFEVLKRDAEIRYWEQVADGGNREALREDLVRTLQDIDEDFLFVAQCNNGDEFLTPEKAERLDAIAQRTWQRTLDDRAGISWEEEKRKARQPKPELPVTEQVLADRPDHLFERAASDQLPEDNPWGFKLKVPEYLYNHGELYNLKVPRGTLTTEERYKINDHVVQTIIMLEKLPYPKHLRDVPTIAGGHHETMDGKGYPKRLDRSQMSVTARMMAIADIFEALTASDRPYKKAKKLSEAIHILSFFKKDNHIDADLFELFLTSGVYLTYARQYLGSEQIDEVAIETYLG